VLDWLPYVAIALIAVVATVALFRIGDDDPIWTERWQALTPEARRRIRASVRTGSLLADPEEIQLAAGLARRRRATLVLGEAWAVVVAGLGVALIVAGFLNDFIPGVVIGVLFVLVVLIGLRSENSVREVMSRGRDY
jgi:hypothetical protein